MCVYQRAGVGREREIKQQRAIYRSGFDWKYFLIIPDVYENINLFSYWLSIDVVPADVDWFQSPDSAGSRSPLVEIRRRRVFEIYPPVY